MRKQGMGIGKLAAVGGAIVGSAGGVPGAAAGASLGGMVGGLLDKPPEQGPQPLATGPTSAMQRRMQAMQQSPQAQIRESIDSLKYIPDSNMRAELAKPLLQADYMAKNRGMA